MTKSGREVLWGAFVKVQGPLISCLSLMAGIAPLLWPIGSDSQVALKAVLAWALPTTMLGLVVVLTLAAAFVQGRSLGQLPRVLHGRAKADEILLLLDESELFGHNSLVSVYYVDASEFEELLGVGRVLNIQENRKIQVTFTARSNPDVTTRLASNDAAALRSIRVKPTVPVEYPQ
jgi:hypothetical protein